MPFTIDFLDDGRVLEWEATAHGAVATERDDYAPRFYVVARDPETALNLTHPEATVAHQLERDLLHVLAGRPRYLLLLGATHPHVVTPVFGLLGAHSCTFRLSFMQLRGRGYPASE